MKRRTLLKAFAGIGCLAGIPYSLWRGVRYPRLSLESQPLDYTLKTDDIALELIDCFASNSHRFFSAYADASNIIFLRAFAPEPKIIVARSDKTQTLVINNISTEAILHSKIPIQEITVGITRVIEIPAQIEALAIEWKFPEHESYEFATIGDTGGAEELGWCIHRAHELGAKFFIHLGDFNYQASDYDTSVEQFVKAPLPCYITIGNHDFHDNGLIVDKFLKDIGPLNHTFNLQAVRYINVDTAASFLPVSGGKRADMMNALSKDKQVYDDTVTFTHRPFYDPRPGEDHDFGNVFEKKWFVKSLKQSNIDTILAGHIHNFFDTESEGIRILIAGQGLGHEDLIHKRQVAKMLVGRVSRGQKVVYRTEDLSMPFEMHCHPHASKWRSDNDDTFAQKMNQMCAPIDARIDIKSGKY